MLRSRHRVTDVLGLAVMRDIREQAAMAELPMRDGVLVAREGRKPPTSALAGDCRPLPTPPEPAECLRRRTGSRATRPPDSAVTNSVLLCR